MKRLIILGLSVLAVLFTGFISACEQHPTQVDSNSASRLDQHGALRTSQLNRINGVGHIREGNFRVSFAGNVIEDGTARWVVQFHEVSKAVVDDGVFKGTSYDAGSFVAGGKPSCQAVMNMTLSGTFNGVPDWSIIFFAGDAVAGSGFDDTVRVTLIDPSNAVIYDTSAGGDFPMVSDCFGIARTELDGGNLSIRLAP